MTLRETVAESRAAPKDGAGGWRSLLDIAGLKLEVTGDRSIPLLGVEGAKGPFVISDGIPDASVKATVGAPGDVPGGRKLFDAGATWQLFDDAGTLVYVFRALAFGDRPTRRAAFSRDFSRGEVLVHPDVLRPGQPLDPLWYPLDELLVGNLLAQGRGVMTHACGLVDPEGRGQLFVGSSGAGKTTMARLWQGVKGVKILSDERIVLRREGGRVWIYGTPWPGEGGMASPAKAPLARVYFLKKAPRIGSRRLGTIDAVARFFPCCFPPYHDAAAVAFTLGFLEEIAGEVPCRELEVVPDAGIVSYILKES